MNNEQRLQFVNEQLRKACKLNTTPSLKISTLRCLFRDSSLEELNDLRTLIDNEICERGTEIKIALSMSKTNFPSRCMDNVLYFEVLKLLFQDYIKTNYTQLTERQSDKLLKLFFRCEEEREKDHIEVIVRTMDVQEDYGMTSEELNTVCANILNIMGFIIHKPNGYLGVITGSKNNKIIRPRDPLVPPFPVRYMDYLSMEITNPYIIEAIEKLRNENIEIQGIIIMTIRVPHNKEIKHLFDNEFGDYIELIDK